ncbi:MAG: response regulator [Acidobacteria bacterium]|nr:response regulator [Acidobacteriota bacterium]
MHKILLVDDTRHFLDLEATFLGRAECRIFTAGTGLEAIRIARRELPDLILLDIEMPEMNGLQACRILKSDAATQRIPVIMLTSMKMEEEARRAGAEHYLRKPIDEPRFLAEVKRFVPIKERDEERLDLTAPVTWWRDGEPASGIMVNLSKSGFLVESADPPPVGARLAVSFTLPNDFSGKTIAAEVMVVRGASESVRGYGCRFFQISQSARQVLESFFERNASRVVRV